MKHVVITPVKNEQDFIGNTLDSILNQTKLPSKWIIVDDGSTDNSEEIILEYKSKNEFIEIVKVKNSFGERMGGGKVVNAFYTGYELIKDDNWDFVSKIDADLTLPENYFEMILDEFNREEKLGICGGYILNEFPDGKIVREKNEEYEVRGALKTVRRKCWEDIGGFKNVWGWDGLDVMEAMFNGWITRTIEIPVVHHRPTTSAYDPLRHQFKGGYEIYKMGSDFFLAMLRSITRFKKRPFVISGFYFLAGYLSAFFKREDKIVSDDLATFINKIHYKRFWSSIKI